MSLIRPLLLCALFIAPGASWACRVPPAEQFVNPDVQIALANDIVLAKVIGAAPRFEKGLEVDYQFLIVKRLTGGDEQLFSLSGRAPGRSGDTTFDHHRDDAFWGRGGGRVMNGTDCVIHPDFVVGKTYLLFRDRPVTRRSFEEIDTADGRLAEDDKWFAYVQARVSRQRSQDPQP